jgi:hypothetical protein
MKRLITTVFLFTLVACTSGCESVKPQPTKLPPAPAKVEAPVEKPKAEPTEAAPKFAAKDLVYVTSADGELKVEGIVIEVGPVTTWTHLITGKEFTSRAYHVHYMYKGQEQCGTLPEIVLEKR